MSTAEHLAWVERGVAAVHVRPLARNRATKQPPSAAKREARAAAKRARQSRRRNR